MFYKFLKFIFYFLVALFLVTAQLALINYPWFSFLRPNLFVAVISAIMMRNSHGQIVWFSFCLFFMLDLFSANNFGFYFFSGTVSTLLIYWFFKELFSKQTIWSLILMITLFVLSIDTIYLFLIYLLNNFSLVESVNYFDFFVKMLIEIFSSVILGLLIYLSTDLILKKINKKYIIN
ncbi:MAG: hypothetical protein WC414_00190 [Patescibacteria group bacterium]